MVSLHELQQTGRGWARWGCFVQIHFSHCHGVIHLDPSSGSFKMWQHTVLPGKRTSQCLFSSEMSVRLIPADGCLTSSLFSENIFTSGWLYPAVRLSQRSASHHLHSNFFLAGAGWAAAVRGGFLPLLLRALQWDFHNSFSFPAAPLATLHLPAGLGDTARHSQVLHLHSTKTIWVFSYCLCKTASGHEKCEFYSEQDRSDY